MLLAEQITPVLNEQRLIRALDPLLATLYEPLPYHNYSHARDEVLVEALRLDDLDRDSRPARQRFEAEQEAERLELIVECLGHDALAHPKLGPDEDFPTKTHRTAARVAGLIRDNMPEHGFTFSGTSIASIEQAIISNTPGQPITTMNELKLRRGDIANVGSHYRSIFLAKTVLIFYETVALNQRDGNGPPEWTSFLDRQHPLLSALIEPGLGIGSERLRNGKSPFDRRAERNISLLASKRAVRDPELFIPKYGHSLTALVPNFAEIAPYIRGRAAA
jgi:hypothetical protein